MRVKIKNKLACGKMQLHYVIIAQKGRWQRRME